MPKLKNEDLTPLRQFVELLALFEKLPDLERVAIQYYIKGRVDAAADNIEIPINTASKAV